MHCFERDKLALSCMHYKNHEKGLGQLQKPMGMVCNCHDLMVSVLFVIFYLIMCLFVRLHIVVFVMVQAVGRRKLGRVMHRFVLNMKLFNIDTRPICRSGKFVNLAFRVMISK